MGNLSMLQALVFEPRKAFAELAVRPRFWFPLLLLVASTVAINVWYTSVVDMEWLVDRQIRTSGFSGVMTEEQISQRVQAAGKQQGMQVAITSIGTLVVVPLLLLLGSVYMVLAGKITNVDRTFRQWFALSCWSGLPSVLGLIPAVFVLLTATSAQIPQEDLQALSFNALFFHLKPGEPGFTLVSTLNLLQLAAIYLATAGVKAWSGRSWLFSFLFAALPYLLIFGIWGFFSFR